MTISLAGHLPLQNILFDLEETPSKNPTNSFSRSSRENSSLWQQVCVSLALRLFDIYPFHARVIFKTIPLKAFVRI